ncbi:MAG: hypothetical protein COV46_04125 [Deltaproteobacteria bacterium CG11_big_fil_rev_8_21_14_0_20_49_13]|nr:MAG: hypothetical protein COV46_04125 [Deltaproteobacteria bacterium CG11_big_fil_rev_8_21_14_0_20_49_13]
MRFLIAVPILLALAYLYPYIPGHDLPWCAIKIGTGLDCPGCGIVRSVSVLLHGHFIESLKFHPLGVVVAGWMIYKWVAVLIQRYKTCRQKRS